MTKRIFRSIIVVALTVLMAALILCLAGLHSHLTSVQYAQLKEETALAAHAVENEGLDYFTSLDSSVASRVTWIAADGSVLFDTRSDSGEMENHLQREEVRLALSTGYGQSARYSDTLLGRYIYSAQRLSDGTILRMSTVQSSVLDLLLEILPFVVAVLVLAAALSMALAGRVSRDIVQPINELNLDDPMSNKEYDEIMPLLQRLQSQQGQLRDQALELQRKQKEFNAVTRSLNEGLVLMNADRTILSINPAAAHLLDVTPNCLGADFSVANRNAGVAALVERAMAGQKAEQTVTLSSRMYLAVANPVQSQGAVFGVVLLLFDITEKQKAEDLRREFTANVSHELKTPLHAISGYAELMKSGFVPQQDMVAFSGKIYAEAQRMSQLVEDTLRLSRLDEGAADMQWETVDLYDLARATVANLSGAAELQDVTLHLEGGSAPIRGIPQLLQSIVFNLTDNAIKYNRPGGSVTVRVDSGATGVQLTVTDTGIGIPPEHQERIFERFYRVDKSHSKEVGGTGLGLSIVKHAALIQNAAIQVQSTVGQGTAISVHFPS